MYKTYVAYTASELLVATGPAMRNKEAALKRLRRLAMTAHAVDLRDLSRPYSRSLIACSLAGRIIGA